MSFTIRPIRAEDAEQVNAIRIMEGVTENVMSLPSDRDSASDRFISGLGSDDHVFVAELDDTGEVIGLCGLHVRAGRKRHSAGLGIMVHREFHGLGVGRELMEKALLVADNFLMLTRVDLEVFTENERAIRLYESLGFEREGIARAAAIRSGVYADCLIMSRIRK